MPAPAERTQRTERLLNLVICLMASRVAVPRAEIQRQIPGYSATTTPAAFERMFERDKDELRSMGIPVETVHDALGDVSGYRILPESYVLEQIDFTVEERAAIAVAAQIWGQAVVAPLAGTALRKLESLDEGPQGWAPADLLGSVQLTAPDAALLPLMSAIRQDRRVRFPYRTPSSEDAKERHVSPWGLRSSSGRWFLVGFDHDRADVRTFRLSRIVGPVSVSAQAREQGPPDDFDIADTDASLPDDAAMTAVLRIAPGRGAALRRLASNPDGGGERFTAEVVTVKGSSLDALTTLVCSAGPDVIVLEPPELVSAVIGRLTVLRDAHREVAP